MVHRLSSFLSFSSFFFLSLSLQWESGGTVYSLPCLTESLIIDAPSADDLKREDRERETLFAFNTPNTSVSHLSYTLQAGIPPISLVGKLEFYMLV